MRRAVSLRTEIIHAGEINGQIVRYCMPPQEDPDMPWVVFDDLAKVAGSSRAERRRLSDITARSWGDEARTVHVRTGRQLIISSGVAKDFMFGLYERGLFGQDVLNECGHAESEAQDALFNRLNLSIEERLRRVFKSHLGSVPTFEVKDDVVHMDRAEIERLTGLSGAALDASMAGFPDHAWPRAISLQVH